MASNHTLDAIRGAQPEIHFRTESGWAFYTERAAEAADRLLAEERERIGRRLLAIANGVDGRHERTYEALYDLAEELLPLL